MFSTALKSFSSNITSNYSVQPSPSSQSGPWKIFNAKKKSTGKVVSVFTFDRRSLEANSSGIGRSGGSGLRKAQDEVVERLRKEASSLARLRHPCFLELVEPVEDTRNGGLQFATELVSTSLAVLLSEKDDQERAGGVGGRTSRYVVEDPDGTGRRRREVEIDELEIQKGLLQVSKGLEFLHENAGLVHGNLTPEAIFVNAKSDWKISGLGFSSPPQDSTSTSSVAPIALSEVLNHDPRLPRMVQLNLDYASPDFVLDTNLNCSADLFSLGLLIVSLYNTPHASPLKTNGSLTSYRRIMSSNSTIPNQSNGFLCSRPLPKDLITYVLPKLLARRPAQRMDSREFQQSQFFDNILVSTIRFLDSLPAKTPSEKSQFMRGLSRVLNQFPKSVLEKKVLPALLEEMKDRELLALVLQNIFKALELLPSRERTFTDKAIPRLREIFLSGSAKSGGASERDATKDAGLMIILDNLKVIIDACTAKDFKDEILPIIHLAMESTTNSLVDASLRNLPTILPVIDFSTLKNDLFPVIANVFGKTTSLGIKVRGLEAFAVLCGSQADAEGVDYDDLNGVIADKKVRKKANTNAVLDKYTVQEKIIPLLKAIKTKEPAVMLAALAVFKQIGTTVDSDFIASDVLPLLWAMSLGPLLNLSQFKEFMNLIKSLSSKVEQDQIRKLQELSSTTDTSTRGDRREDFLSFGAIKPGANGTSTGAEDDFEKLVLGRNQASGTPSAATAVASNPWGGPSSGVSSSTIRSPQPQSNLSPSFSWSTSATLTPSQGSGVSRTITPDLTAFTPLAPTTVSKSASLNQQHSSASAFPSAIPQQQQPNWNTGAGINQATAAPNYTNSAWGSQPALKPTIGGVLMSQGTGFGMASQNTTSFGIPPPQAPNPGFQGSTQSAWNIAPPPPTVQSPAARGTKPPAQKSGLDAYQSLL